MIVPTAQRRCHKKPLNQSFEMNGINLSQSAFNAS